MQTRETHHVSEATDVASCDWSDLHTAAWLGMLQTYRHLTRDLDAELEDGSLVERHTCPEDGRAVNAWLTRAGLELVGAAQATHFAGVQRDFFAHLSAGELRTLADVFTRVAPDARAACLS